MKKYLVTSVLACTALCSSAFAADGAINVTGKIVDNACVVSPTLDVRLGDTAAADFEHVGDWGYAEEFFLELKDCPANIKAATVQLDGEADSNNKNLFQLISGGATGVALELIAISGSGWGNQPIVPGGTSEEFSLNEGENRLSFAARYRSTDKVTAGDANATIQFSVLYN
ncbi:TPA: fimbrial protein [Serratia marcescens]